MDRGKTFICNSCIRKRSADRPCFQKGRGAESPLEEHVAAAFDRKKYSYKRNFKLGKYRFDFAFLRFKLLLEIDGKSYHKHTPNSRKAALARKHGWTLVRISNGKHLIRRVMETVCEHATVVKV
jgi:very-short-patch-repair endonuclease